VQGEREHIAFDGKVIRGSGNGSSLNPLQLMSAMVVDSGLILYQQEVSDKTDEIPVMQAMLQCLSVKGAIITADAMHCQTQTTEIVRAEGADYMLQVKDNQRNLSKETSVFFHKTYRDTPEVLEERYFEEIEKAHGRINERYYRLLPITDWLAGNEHWKDIQYVVVVTRKRTFKKKGNSNRKCLITSPPREMMSKKLPGLSEIIGPSKIANIGCWMSHSEKMKVRYMLRMGRKTWPYSDVRYLI
jgi:predicted transposase YbfD/YdcC